MKTRKIIACILLVATLVGLLAGCKKSEKKSSATKATQFTAKATEPEETTEPSIPYIPRPTLPEGFDNPADSNQETLPPEETFPDTPPDPDCIHVTDGYILKSTCTTEGATKKLCRLCNSVVETIPIPKLPHNNKWEIKEAATCEKEGIMYQQCQDCNEIFAYIQTEKLEHEENMITHKCVHCGKYLGTTTPDNNQPNPDDNQPNPDDNQPNPDDNQPNPDNNQPNPDNNQPNPDNNQPNPDDNQNVEPAV